MPVIREIRNIYRENPWFRLLVWMPLIPIIGMIVYALVK